MLQTRDSSLQATSARARADAEQILQDEENRQPRRRRIHVIGRLAHVDVIVRMDARVASEPIAEELAARLASTSFAFMLWDVPAPA